VVDISAPSAGTARRAASAAKRDSFRTIRKGAVRTFCEANVGLPREDEDMTTNKNPGNFANDREKASEAGRKGGHNSGGNFANDREKASEAGRKGGQNSHGGGR
jgi:hypothetical protein